MQLLDDNPLPYVRLQKGGVMFGETSGTKTGKTTTPRNGTVLNRAEEQSFERLELQNCVPFNRLGYFLTC